MGRGASSKKIKQMTPEKLAERREAALLKVVSDVGATIGLPEIQRRPDDVSLHIVPQLGSAARTTDRTLRKLTRVEKLQRSGVLDRHEADACGWYADVVAMAWDTVGCTANYDGAGSGNYSGASDRALVANKRQADAREDYRMASASLPTALREIFEAVICHNVSIASIAVERFADAGRTQREERTRKIVKFCANLVHGAISHRLPVDSVAPAAVVVRVAEAVVPQVRISDAIAAAIDADPAASVLLVSSDVLAALVREQEVKELDRYLGVGVVVREGWRWAWILQG